ncbi:hypothetical protein CD144_03985 [Staphylococcus equorum subsp. linens]|nr:hypothetical protein CD144_03985 [Staphylococcus equorum subsp. linens]QQT19213.1 hypothetical protein I6J07_13650 [Staphylococcus equorum]
MPSQDQKKAKTININLTEEEYEKVRALAQIRDLNPTAYTRLAALGNRIKPTVIEIPKEQITIDEHEEIEKMRVENKELKEIVQRNTERVEAFNSLVKHVKSQNGYLDLKSYRNDEELMRVMAKYGEK